MSKLDSKTWSDLPKGNLNKYEKCRNITEEIYKRINITFQIKKLENAAQSELSENSDQLDSNELSNETDLFACDKSDSIPSSNEDKVTDRPTQDKYININNNEETKKKAVAVYKRPKKRFRKRVKKRQSKTRDSDCSSDEAEPLSRVADIATVTKDLKPKILPPDNKPLKTAFSSVKHNVKQVLHSERDSAIDKKIVPETKNCSMCSLSFRGERGLRRHMAITHIIDPADLKAMEKST